MSPPARLLALLGLAALTGCGFSPLYGDNSGPATVAQQLGEVEVENIPERPGQMLRQAIEDQLTIAGAPTVQRYALAVTYIVISQGIGIQSDTSVTRNRYIATAAWTLTPIGAPPASLATGASPTPLATGVASTEDAENVIDQQYFALTLEADTINRQLAQQLSQQITTQLAAWFKQHPSA